jgi:hypothetical protein
VVTPPNTLGTGTVDAGPDINPFEGEQLADENAMGGLEAAFAGAPFMPTYLSLVCAVGMCGTTREGQAARSTRSRANEPPAGGMCGPVCSHVCLPVC